MPYDPAIHHRRSIRLKGYDFSQEGNKQKVKRNLYQADS
jgi:hypothetical protein